MAAKTHSIFDPAIIGPAIGESFKKLIPTGAGTVPVSGPLFVVLVIGTIVLVGALTFFPALSLGPILEHFLMHSGKLF